jgi:polysaccharide export outer membrane protein
MNCACIALAGLAVAVATTAAGQDNSIPATAISGYSSVAVTSTDAAPALQERHPRYRLRKGDTFDLDFALSPEFNQTVAVQPDGYVTLNGVGSIFVEGQTVPELAETVKAAYAKTLHDPIIAIALRDFEKPYFIASGQVGKPGKYDLRSDLTVVEAVAIAGGFTEKSKHSQVVLFGLSREVGMRRSFSISRNCSPHAIYPKMFNCNPGICCTCRRMLYRRFVPFCRHRA